MESKHKFKAGDIVVGQSIIIGIVSILNDEEYYYEFLGYTTTGKRGVLKINNKYVGSKKHIDERCRLQTPLEELI